MMTKSHNNTPQLRFPEFSGEWKGNTLAEISFLITKGTTPTSVGYKFQKKGVNFIKVENISKNSTVNIRSTPKISNECNLSLKRSILKKHDILFTIAGTLGRTAIIQEKDLPANTNQAVAIIRLNSDQNVKFINLLLNSTKIKKRIYQLLSIGAQPNLSLEQVGSFMLDYPSATEQQKIAVFLSTVEGWIENLKQQKKALEQYKKGMMQKIFSQEVRFRDDDGNEYPEWKERRLGDVSILGRNGLQANTIEKANGTYNVYGAAGFYKKIDFYEEKEPYIAIVKDGAGVGRLLFSEGKSSVISTLDVLKPMSGVIPKYLFYLLQILDLKKYIIGSTIPHIYYRNYKREAVNVPCSQEQQKIAEFLTSLDNLIESNQQQISQAAQWKKGLLQKMFV